MVAISPVTMSPSGHPKPQIALDMGLTSFIYDISAGIARVEIPDDLADAARELGYLIIDGGI